MGDEDIKQIKRNLISAFFTDSEQNLKPMDCYKLRKYIASLEDAVEINDSCMSLMKTIIRLMSEDLLKYTGLPNMTAEDIEEVYIEKAQKINEDLNT